MRYQRSASVPKGPISLQELVKKVEDLPQMPEAALRLMRMMEDSNSSAEKIAEVIRLDPGMTTQVLRLCNSAAYGFSRKITTVRDAVTILGFNTIRSLVYIIISKFALDQPVEGYGLEKGQLWKNALSCAVYAKAITENYRLINPELSFTGALLRDIGKIILGEYVGVNYAEIEDASLKTNIDFVKAEEAVIGFSHTTVGMKVAEKWNLPEQLTKVIRYHHKPSDLISKERVTDTAKLVTLVHLADVFTVMIGKDIGVDGLMYSLDMDAFRQIGLPVDEECMENMLIRLISLDDVIEELADSLTPERG